MATALKLKRDINKLKAAIKSKATPQSYVPKLKAQLEKAEADYESVKSGKRSVPKASKQVKSTLDKLKQIIKKKKYSAYRAQGVDLKKDADRPALPTGKRISKSGNTYYEYRANRIDVKQPPKRYPKLEDGGEMNRDTFSNIFLSNGFSERKSFDGIRFFVNKKHKYDNKIIYSTVDLSNKKVIIEDEDGNIYYEGFSVLGVIEGLKKLGFEKGGYMAEGGQVKWLLQRDNGEEWVKYNKYKSGLNAYKLTPTKELAVEFDKREDAEKLINDLQKELDASLIVVRLKMAGGGYMAGGGKAQQLYKSIMKDKLKALEEEISTINLMLKKLENENTEESYKASQNLREYKAVLEAKKLNLEDTSKEKGGYMEDGGGTDMLKEDDMVWNAVGNKLEVYKVTKDEYYLKGFMQPSPMPFSKKKVHNYLKMGEWSLKPKMADGGTIDNSGITPADLQKQIWNLTARIAKLGDIESQASYDEINMLMKQRKKLQSMALNHGDVVMAQGGELHRSQEEKFKYGGYMSEGGNTDEEKQIFFFVKPRMVNELTQKANNENVELEFIETNEDGNEVYRAELTDAQINHFTKLPLQYDFEYDYAKGGYMAHGGKLDSGVYRVGKPRKVLPMLYEQKIVEIFDNGDIATASDYARKLNDFKVQSYPIITNEQLEAQYKMEKGGYMSKGGETVPYIIWVSKDGEKREFYGTYKSQRAADMAMRKLWDSSDYKSMGNKPKKMYEKEGFYAKGGATEHGLKKGDTIWADQFWDNTVIVDNPKTGRAVVNLETGKRKEQGKI